MKIKYLILLLPFIAVSNKKLCAQYFFKGHHASAQPQQVIIDNYKSIVLRSGNKSSTIINQFDTGNPYTYIQSVYDENDKIYQILYQTDFGGDILFLAYSYNLEEIFNRSDKPLYRFMSCIEAVNTSDFSTENIEKALECVIERLNYCRE